MSRITAVIAMLVGVAAFGQGVGSAAPATTARAQITLYGAGSLSGVMPAIGQLYARTHDVTLVGTYGPSGLLRERIERGARPDVFASADLASPARLQRAGLAGPVTTYIHNRLCILARPGLAVTSSTLLAVMLNPAVKVATSTPMADPGGDYAELLFAKADVVRPGSKARLDAKALRLVGGAHNPPVPPGHDAVGYFLLSDRADVFVTYCSSAKTSIRLAPSLQLVQLPPALAVTVDFGETVLRGAGATARDFAQFLLTPAAQRLFVQYGFVSSIISSPE